MASGWIALIHWLFDYGMSSTKRCCGLYIRQTLDRLIFDKFVCTKMGKAFTTIVTSGWRTVEFSDLMLDYSHQHSMVEKYLTLIFCAKRLSFIFLQKTLKNITTTEFYRKVEFYSDHFWFEWYLIWRDALWRSLSLHLTRDFTYIGKTGNSPWISIKYPKIYRTGIIFITVRYQFLFTVCRTGIHTNSE